MKSQLDQAEHQFLEQLHRLGASTVSDIGEAIGVTATAVRQRLTRLQGLGFISREVERAGRGRPHHKYCVTDKGLRTLGDNYSDLALTLWREIQKLPNSAVQNDLKERIREGLVARFGDVVHGPTLGERLEQLQAELRERGYDV